VPKRSVNVNDIDMRSSPYQSYVCVHVFGESERERRLEGLWDGAQRMHFCVSHKEREGGHSQVSISLSNALSKKSESILKKVRAYCPYCPAMHLVRYRLHCMCEEREEGGGRKEGRRKERCTV
jgi:hypothetical protein